MFCRITKRRYGLAPMNRVRVVILNAALGPLDYRAPKGAVVEPGAIVLAPLGPRQVTGVVWEPNRLDAGAVEANSLRPLLHVYVTPPNADPLTRLVSSEERRAGEGGVLL